VNETREYVLEKAPALLHALGAIGGTALGYGIAGKVIRSPIHKEEERVKAAEKAAHAAEKSRKASTIREGAGRAIMKTLRYVKNNPKATGKLALGSIGLGAATAGLDRAAAYATIKKDRQLAHQAALRDLERQHGTEKAAKVNSATKTP